MSLRPLLRGAAGSFVLNALAKALMLAASVLLARMLGPGGFGAYSAAVALALLLAAGAGLGLPTLVVRLVSAHGARGEWSLVRGALVYPACAVLVVALAVAALAGLLTWLLEFPHAAVLAWAFALVPLLALNALRSAALRGLHRVVFAQVPDCAALPAALVAALLAWEALGATLTPALAAALRFGATLGAFALGTALLVRSIPREARAAAPACDAPAWRAAAAPLLFISLLSVVNLQVDVLLLAALRGPESAGVYQAAARGAELVAFSLLVANFALQPMISRLHALGDTQALQRAATATARAALALALPIALALVVFATPLLGAVFGAAFERGALCLAILCAGQVAAAAMGAVGHLLNMTGHERDAALGMALGAGANVALNLLLVPFWDIEGAALASAASLVLCNLALSRRVRRRLGISGGAAGPMTHVRAA